MATETEITAKAPRWLRVTIYAQVVMAAVAVCVSILAAKEIRPLLIQRDDLRSQVDSLKTQ